jgi:hypothetical protein
MKLNKNKLINWNKKYFKFKIFQNYVNLKDYFLKNL